MSAIGRPSPLDRIHEDLMNLKQLDRRGDWAKRVQYGAMAIMLLGMVSLVGVHFVSEILHTKLTMAATYIPGGSLFLFGLSTALVAKCVESFFHRQNERISASITNKRMVGAIRQELTQAYEPDFPDWDAEAEIHIQHLLKALPKREVQKLKESIEGEKYLAQYGIRV